MDLEIKEIRIAGYKFVFEMSLVDSGYIHMGFNRRDWIVRAFLGGKPYDAFPTQSFTQQEAVKKMVDYITWTFKR